MNMGDLVALLFLSREQAHRAHLKASGVGAYAAHVALNDFYDNILDSADTIAEKYQGEYSIQLDIPFLANPSVGDVYDTILPVLKANREWINTNRYLACPKDKTAIQNLIDEAVAVFDEAIYKMTFLK